MTGPLAGKRIGLLAGLGDPPPLSSMASETQIIRIQVRHLSLASARAIAPSHDPKRD